MIYTPREYAETFKVGNKKVSARTVIRRAVKGLLPSNHKARKIPGTRVWVIETPGSE